jgi:hypothetical protein
LPQTRLNAINLSTRHPFLDWSRSHGYCVNLLASRPAGEKTTSMSLMG